MRGVAELIYKYSFCSQLILLGPAMPLNSHLR